MLLKPYARSHADPNAHVNHANRKLMPSPCSTTMLPAMPSSPFSIAQLQLHILIHQPHLLSILERRQPDIRTPIATERIPQSTIPTATDFSLDREIHFCKLVGLELCRVGGSGRGGGVVSGRVKLRESGVSGGAFCCVLSFEAGGETAGAVFAGAAAFSGFGTAFWCCRHVETLVTNNKALAEGKEAKGGK